MSNGPMENETLARQLCEQKMWNGSSIPVGSFVAISDGRVLGIGASYELADAYLHAAGISPGEGMICEITELEADVIR